MRTIEADEQENPRIWAELHGKTIRTALIEEERASIVFEDDSMLEIAAGDDGGLIPLYFKAPQPRTLTPPPKKKRKK
jgi:hypothetical protein